MQSLVPAGSTRRKTPPAHVTDLSKCWAKAKTTGKQCTRPQKPHQTVCRFHGGESPNALRVAAQREAEQRAAGFLSTLEYEPLEDPLGELARIASEAVAAKNFFKTQIEELRYKGQTGEQLRSEVALWERAIDRCDKILSNMVRLGLADRITRVREAEVMLMSEALDRMFDRMDFSPAQRAEAEVIIIEELEAVSAEKAT